MKALPVLALICALSATALAQSPLTNKDVVELIKAGLGPEVVATKIRTSPTAFDTSPNALKDLKREGVPDSVILAMLEPKAPDPKAADLVLVPEGTAFTVELLDDVSSETASEGDPVTLKATESVTINGRLVIKTGAIVKGTVEQAQRSGSAGRAGVVRVGLKTVNAADGQKIRVSASRSSTGQDRTHRAARETAEHNPFSGMVRGGKAKLRAGMKVTVYTDEDKLVKAHD